MPTLHAASATMTPIFSDPSGRRAPLLKWLARGLCAGFVLVCGAVAFTLLTQVPLPGLRGLLPHSPGTTAPRAVPDPAADSGGSTEAPRLFTPVTPVTQSSEHAARAQGRTPAHGSGAAGVTNATMPTSSGSGFTDVGGTTATPATHPNGPAANANPHASTKTRNPQAALKKSNAHAATGRARVDETDGSTWTPPGKSK
jgi:hypothetical protein